MALLVVATFATLDLRLARADVPAGADAADALFEQARDDMRRGAYESAYAKLVESEQMDPSNGTLLNLVLCEERLGKIASAWLHVRALVQQLPDGDDRKPIAERRLAGLWRRAPKLSVRRAEGAPLDIKVKVDDNDLAASSFGVQVPIDPGLHVLIASASGRSDQVEEISIDEGREYEWIAGPRPIQVPARVQSAPADALRPVPAPDGSSARWLGWTATGLGAASLALGGVMALLTLDRRAIVEANCHEKQCQDASGLRAAAEGKRFLGASLAASAVGVAGLGGGIYLLLRRDVDQRTDLPRRSLGPPSTTMLFYTGAF